MRFSVITIFPEIFDAYLSESLIGKACENGLVEADVINLRDFTKDKHRSVDDVPYGGGPGMVMKPEPFGEAVKYVKSDGLDTLTIMVTPQGMKFNQRMAEALAKESRRLLFLCGRYEGIDDRVREALVDEEISIGDYVLAGGELPTLVIIEAVIRLLPGVVGDRESLTEESFSWGILDYPHFTRPPEWNGFRVPDVLMSGNHKQIDRYRRKEALRRTMQRRPDIINSTSLSDEDNQLIEEIKEEKDGLHKGD